ncbi:MAG: glycosyltransferase [Methylotenera sp.]|nr:glycosyltransferase [Methylotenera sp.]
MKIVFITHYFPPLNSSGARRVNAFAKYFAMWGHTVTVITARKSDRDGLLTEPVPEYLKLLEIDSFGQLSASKLNDINGSINDNSVKSRSAFGVFLLRIKRGVMRVAGQLIDHRIVFALQFLLPWLSKDVKESLRNADVVITSCPPWPAHLAGCIVKSKYKKPWVADYRDQFSGNHILRGSFLSRPLEVFLDKWLIKSADHVLAISPPMQEYYLEFHSKVSCIENGYDSDVFKLALQSSDDVNDAKFSDEFLIRYLGTITSDRIPVAFLNSLVKINQLEGPKMFIEFYGESTLLRQKLPSVVPDAIPYVRYFKQLSYFESIKKMLSSDALFFIETSDFSSNSARGVLTTKLFEYLAAKKPVIAEINQKALAASYIKKSGLGAVISENEVDIYNGLQMLREKLFTFNPNVKFIESLSREVKAESLQDILVSMIDSGHP